MFQPLKFADIVYFGHPRPLKFADFEFAECLSFLPSLLPGAIAWGMLPGKGDESDSPRSGYAGQKNPA